MMNRQEMINAMPEGKSKELEQRWLELDERIEVGADPMKLGLKIGAMYEMFKEVYGDEMPSLETVLSDPRLGGRV